MACLFERGIGWVKGNLPDNYVEAHCSLHEIKATQKVQRAMSKALGRYQEEKLIFFQPIESGFHV
jgi:rhamnogalacturonyl hydrolase YesR